MDIEDVLIRIFHNIFQIPDGFSFLGLYSALRILCSVLPYGTEVKNKGQ